MEELKKVREATDFLLKKGIGECDTGVILGTGLGGFAKEIDPLCAIEYDDIPHFPVSTVESHHGRLIYGKIGKSRVLVMQGRFHYYEGYDARQITFPIRVMHELGIGRLLVSNAAGALNTSFKKGDLMLISDHINLQSDNPLRGKNVDECGARFPDMSEAYSVDIRSVMKDCARELNVPLQEGVYVAVTGPNLETAAEYRFLHRIGADAVGMSTIPEVLTAVHMGMKVGAVSVLTDECNPDYLEPVNIEDILAVAATAEKKLIRVFKAYLER